MPIQLLRPTRLAMPAAARIVAGLLACALSGAVASCTAANPTPPANDSTQDGGEDSTVLAQDHDGAGDSIPGDSDEQSDSEPNGDDSVSANDGDGGANDNDNDAPTAVGPAPSILPIAYSRPDTGTPLTPGELAAATDELVALLVDTRYFPYLDEHIHGWPENHPSGGYWYGTYWSGVTVQKQDGTVTYRHAPDGADNNGLRTGPYLEGACYATMLWGNPMEASLVRRMVRGFSSWALSMVRTSDDTNPTLLSRAFYPMSVASSSDGRSMFIDYSANRPGINADPSDYVHLPTNPTFGDIYIKNKRSKDDIGPMLRALSAAGACRSWLEPPGRQDVVQARELYRSWAQRVDSQGFVIETLDTSGNLLAPTDQLARYTLAGDAECVGALAIRMLGEAAPGDLDCGDGFSTLEQLAWPHLKNDARQILRSHHAAALLMAYERGELQVAQELLEGLTKRIDRDFSLATSSSPPDGFVAMDVASLLIYGASAGVPLTSAQIRWLHERLHEAFVVIRDPAYRPIFDVFSPSFPDGAYGFDAPNVGLFHRDLGMLLGACAAPYRNDAGPPLLDCARLAAAL